MSIAIAFLGYAFVRGKNLLEEFKEMEFDLGVSYYKLWFTGIFFTVAGILMLLDVV